MDLTSSTAKTYFIADLHLTDDRPDITACFLSFLKDKAPEADALYILGDLFEYWIGDDDKSEYIWKIASSLKELSSLGTPIYFIHGNRDFLLGQKFAQKAGMILLPEITTVDLYGRKSVIMHGDTLCTKDTGYQEFRKKSRSWWWQLMIKSLPLFIRRKIAEDYRRKSASATALKSQEIMDVTPSEVERCLIEHNSDLLIHGHTHRPAQHKIYINSKPAERIVLGDWYEQGAWLIATPSSLTLLNEPL